MSDEVEAMRLLGLARGMSWTPEEAEAVGEQLAGIRAGLERAQAAVDAVAEEPTTAFAADAAAT